MAASTPPLASPRSARRRRRRATKTPSGEPFGVFERHFRSQRLSAQLDRTTYAYAYAEFIWRFNSSATQKKFPFAACLRGAKIKPKTRIGSTLRAARRTFVVAYRLPNRAEEASKNAPHGTGTRYVKVRARARARSTVIPRSPEKRNLARVVVFRATKFFHALTRASFTPQAP